MSHLPIACLLLASTLPAAAGEALVVSEHELSSRWLARAPPVSAPWPPALREAPAPACVALGFRIARDGATGGFVVLRAWSAAGVDGAVARRRGDLLAQSAAAATAAWRFEPAGATARKPVFTSATHVFGAAPGAAAAISRQCEIEDLGGFVAQAEAAARRRGSLLLGRIDRKRVSDPAMIPDGISPDGVSRHPGWAD